MQENQNLKQYYVTINRKEGGKKVEETILVSEEIYQAYKRPLWREHKRQTREALCRMSGKCIGDCRHCNNQQPHRALSLEGLMEDGVIPGDSFSLENYVIEKELYQALYTALTALNEKDRLIMILYAQGLSERKIAEKVGLKQKSVNDHKHKTFKALRELLKDFV